MTLDLIRFRAANLATWRGSVLPALGHDREMMTAAYEAGRKTQTEVLSARLAELEGSVAAVNEESHLSALALDALALLGRPPDVWLGAGPTE